MNELWVRSLFVNGFRHAERCPELARLLAGVRKHEDQLYYALMDVQDLAIHGMITLSDKERALLDEELQSICAARRRRFDEENKKHGWQMSCTLDAAKALAEEAKH